MESPPIEQLVRMRGLARALAGSDADADDLLQDTALALLERPQPDVRALRPWLATVVVNRWRMTRRATLRRRARELAYEAPAPPDVDRSGDVPRLLAALSEPYRALVIAHYFAGKTSR